MLEICHHVRATAARQGLAAVVVLAVFAGCQDVDHRTDAGRTTTGSTSTATPTTRTRQWQVSRGEFTLSIRPNVDHPTQVHVLLESSSDALAHLNIDHKPAVLELRTEAPLLGSVERVSENAIRFRPSFPLLPGQVVTARFRPDALDRQNVAPLECRYQVPSPAPAPAPIIEAVYPTATALPSNHLKFYIVFSEPMQPGDIWQHFQLVDLDNKRPVPRPFRHTELWSRDARTLTLWFHPGRVKQGVNLNSDLGAILVEGHHYELRVSGLWPSARGTPLGKDVVRTFRAVEPDHVQPDPTTWKLDAPRADTRDPITCQLGASLDWALLHSDVAVETADGESVRGTIRVSDHESTWTFKPDTPWSRGRYRLAVGSVLEDLAGNNLERPFEVDLESETPKRPEAASAPPAPTTVYRHFDVTASPAPPAAAQAGSEKSE